MKRWFLPTLLLALGCAHRPTIPDAIHAVNVAAAGGDVALQAAAGAWAGYVDARIAVCAAQGLQDETAREACMAQGGAGPLDRAKVEEAFGAIVEAQKALAGALKAAEAAYESVRPSLERAMKEKSDG